MGVTGLTVIIVNLIMEWFQQIGMIERKNTNMVVTLILVTLLFVILWQGKYLMLEKLLSSLVILMGLSFLLTVFFVVPSWREIFAGLKPQIPNEPNATLIVAGMAGTTLSSAMLFCRSVTLKSKGWGLGNKKNALTDTLVSVTAMFLLSFAVMICAAGTLYAAGTPVENAIDMVKTIEPLAGRSASIIFIVGLVGAGISSLIPTILIAPWLISDFNNTSVNPKSKESRIFVILGVIVALIAPFINAKPVFLMIITMALLSIVLPLSTISITILMNKKILGRHKNNVFMNIACACAVFFSVVMSYYGIIGLLEYFQ